MPIYNPPPTAVPTIHHTTHETGGSDVVAAIDGSVITSGSVAAARGGTGTTTGLTVLSASNVTTGTLPVAQLPATVARTDVANTFTSGDALKVNGASYARLELRDLSQPADLKAFDWISWSQVMQCRALNDASGGVSTPLEISRSGNVKVGADIYEKGRTTPMGHWISVPFNAGNFYVPSGTWTVTAGNVAINRYTLIGKTVQWICAVNGSSLSGTLPTYGYITLPVIPNSSLAQFYFGRAGYVSDASGELPTYLGVEPVNGRIAFVANRALVAGSFTLHFSVTYEMT